MVTEMMISYLIKPLIQMMTSSIFKCFK
jgi:hypothetical protein